VSLPALFDYQVMLVHEAVVANRGTVQAGHGVWWIQNNSVHGMQNGFNYYSDLLATYDPPTMPTDLTYHATGVGVFFARSAWTKDATWLSFIAGPYDESHAHQEQGAFTFYKRTWLAVTSNIWSHSGIEQDVSMHNIVRFVKNGANIGQSESTTVASSMTYTNDPDGVHVHADLTNAYSRSSADVRSWKRDLTFQGNTLRVQDTCDVGSGVQAVWQIHTPVQPVAQGDGSFLAGNLRIKPVAPATITVNLVQMNTVNSEVEAGRWRTELSASSGCGFTVDLIAQ
jgi:hypothetical protein